MRDGILTEESYRNVARCPPMTLNVSVVSCVGRSPYMYAKKARARRPHGRPHGRTPTSHKTPTQNSRPLCRYRSNADYRLHVASRGTAAPLPLFHTRGADECRLGRRPPLEPGRSAAAALPPRALVAARRPRDRRVDRYSATGSLVLSTASSLFSRHSCACEL